MDEARLLEFEQAAAQLMSPPYLVSAEVRKKAEMVFLDLRKTQLPYEICKSILEHSRSEYVLFQAASTIKEGVIREWHLLSSLEKEHLRDFIMHYLTTSTDLASYVAEQLLHVVAVMVKRSTLETDKRQLFDAIFTVVSQLLAASNVKMRHLGCSLLSSLLTEYASSSGSSSMGLPLDFHIQCKRVIEEEEILRILHFAVQVLHQYVSATWAVLSKEDLHLLSGFLKLTSQVLHWDFRQTTFRSLGLNSSEVMVVPLRPPSSYVATFLDASFVNVFFKLLSGVRESEEHVHYIIQCLTQLASLTRPVFVSDQDQQAYVAHFVAGILGYVQAVSDLNQQELYGLSCILRRLATTHPARHFSPLPDTQLELLVRSLTHLTCLCAQAPLNERLSKEDLMTHQESLEHFLEVWVNLLEGDEGIYTAELLSQALVGVFQTYVQSKLSAPRGWSRSVLCEDEEEELIVEDSDDQSVFSDQLSSVGHIARVVAGTSVPLLTTLLEQCSAECLHLLAALRQEDRRSSLCSQQQQRRLDSLYEDIHWLTLIAGYTLCDIVQGEDVRIPAQLMRHSILHQGEAQLDFNISALLWQQDGVAECPPFSELKLDPIVALVVGICRLCVLERLFITNGLQDLLSPQVCKTTSWCLSRITEPYLMLSEENYEQISLPLLAAFGACSGTSSWLTVFMMEEVVFNLSVWSSEEQLAMTTIQLLKSLVKSPQRVAVAIQCESLWTLVREFSLGCGPVSTFPPSVQRELMGGLVMCGIGQRKDEFLTELLQPLRKRFTELVQRPDLRSRCHDREVQQNLLGIMEAMCGVAQSTRPDAVQEFYEFLLPLLRVSVPLMELYLGTPDVVTVILELFSLVAENYSAFLDEVQMSRLYEVCLVLIQTYAKSNTVSRFTRRVLSEEEQCEDLLLFMKLLSHLTTKDYINFAESDSSSVQPIDVVLAGLSIILPLMKEDVLQFPPLCVQFYTLVGYICEVCPEKIVVLPEDMLSVCMHAMEIGLNCYGPDVSRLSMDCVKALAAHYTKLKTPPCHLTHAMQHFLKVILDMVLSSTFDMDLLPPAAAALYALVCAQKEYYSSLVETLVTTHCTQHYYKRLVEALGNLTPPSLSLDLSRTSTLQFRENLEKCLPIVKGFLCYR